MSSSVKAKFLREGLRGGARAVEDLKDEAKVLGLAWATVRRAVKVLGVTTLYPHQTAGRYE